jgi:hypothetical protein
MIYVYSFLISFITVGLRGFQHKNVIGNHKKAVFVTAYLVAVGDVLTVGMVVLGGWTICFAAGTGAAVGMVCSMYLHDRIFKRENG